MEKNQLAALVRDLSSDEPERELWSGFLSACLACTDGGEDLAQALRGPLAALVDKLGEAVLGAKLKEAVRRFPEFPLDRLLQMVLELCGERRQQVEQTNRELRQMLSELATPIIRIWTDVLLVPLIGTLDSERAQTIAERLLERISTARAKVAVVDVTGVSVIDTAVGGFLIEMFSAVRLLGADVILTGIKPEVAHTLVKLGISFGMVSIARDLEDALRRAIAIIEEERKQRRQFAPGLGVKAPVVGGVGNDS